MLKNLVNKKKKGGMNMFKFPMEKQHLNETIESIREGSKLKIKKRS